MILIVDRIDRFNTHLLYVLNTLKRLVAAVNYKQPIVRSNDRPLSIHWANFIMATSVDTFMQMYSPAILLEVKLVLGQKSFKKDDLLDLPSD